MPESGRGMKKYDFERVILGREDLTATETLVALVMLSHRNNKTGLCYPSQSTIARQAKLSLRAVGMAVKTLREKGVITGEAETGKVIHYEFEPTQLVRTPCATGAHKPRKNQLRQFFARMTPDQRKEWAIARAARIEETTDGADVAANREINRLRRAAGLKPGE